MRRMLAGLSGLALLIGAGIVKAQTSETYSVRNGDTLSSIAQRHRTSVAEIMKANRLDNPHKLSLGMTLRIPRNSAGVRAPIPATKQPTKVTATHTNAGFTSYTVRQTDNLWSIARRVQISYKTLAHVNGINRPDQLKPGMMLRIPVHTPMPVATAFVEAAIARANVSTKPTAVQSGFRTYRVQNGDSVWSVARKFQISWKKIAHANGLTKPDQLKLDMNLRIPTDGGAPTKMTASVPKTTSPSRSGPVTSKWAAARKDRVIIRSAPEIGKRITLIDRWAKMQVGTYSKGWYRVRLTDGRVGWVRADLIANASAPQRVARLAKRPPARVASVSSKSKKPSRTTQKVARSRTRKPATTRVASSRTVRRNRATGRPEPALEPSDERVVQMAYGYRGVRYRYGGTTSRGFDCSGFAQHVYRRAGVRLPRTATQQASVGSKVSRGDLRSGDLVFFHTTRGKRIGHVGVYVGNNKFIHASSGGGRVRVDSLGSSYYNKRFVTARRYQSKTTKVVTKPEEPKAVTTTGSQPDSAAGTK